MRLSFCCFLAHGFDITVKKYTKNLHKSARTPKNMLKYDFVVGKNVKTSNEKNWRSSELPVATAFENAA